jgi:hypothetical protein
MSQEEIDLLIRQCVQSFHPSPPLSVPQGPVLIAAAAGIRGALAAP